MSKKQETYYLGLSVYYLDRGKHHWAVGDSRKGIIAQGDEGTHRKAKKTGMIALLNFCRGNY
jgi:hypothetical protein